MRSNQTRYLIILFILLFGYGFFTNLSNGVSTHDESWFLQVVARFLAGEVLYRDIFLGVTPLSVYVTAVPASLFGVEILVVKGMNALLFAGTVLIGWHILQQFNGNRTMFTLAMLVYAFPRATAVYSPLAMFWLAACFDLMLLAYSAQKLRWVFAAGAIAGLAFVTKQNIGAYALTAAGLSIIALIGLQRIRVLLKASLATLVGFLLPTGLLLLPVLLTNSIREFWDYGFGNKALYLELGRVSFIYQWLQSIPSLSGLSFDRLQSFHVDTLYLLAPVTLIALLVLILKRPRDKIGWIVLLFAAAAFIGAFPRVDSVHMSNTAPLILIAASYIWGQWSSGLSRPIRRLTKFAVILWFVAGLTFLFQPRLHRLVSGGFEVSTLQHFQGALIQRGYYRVIQRQLVELVGSGDIESPLLVFPNASFYYLLTGYKNPTPFDYPLATAFGSQGEANVIRELSQGAIHRVCFRSAAESGVGEALRPRQLEEFITTQMVPVRELDLCTEFQLP